MENTQVVVRTVVKAKNIAAVNFSVVFVALSVALPWFAHQFQLAGPTYLPMHFFILFAGLLLGWRTGLIVGLFTPLISYAVSGMPMMSILPQITVEVALYGLVAGLAREAFRLNLYWSLLISLIVGRLGSLLAIVIFNSGSSHTITSVLQATKTGWPGLLIQIALIPLLVYVVKRYIDAHDQQSSE